MNNFIASVVVSCALAFAGGPIRRADIDLHRALCSLAGLSNHFYQAAGCFKLKPLKSPVI